VSRYVAIGKPLGRAPRATEIGNSRRNNTVTSMIRITRSTRCGFLLELPVNAKISRDNIEIYEHALSYGIASGEYGIAGSPAPTDGEYWPVARKLFISQVLNAGTGDLRSRAIASQTGSGSRLTRYCSKPGLGMGPLNGATHRKASIVGDEGTPISPRLQRRRGARAMPSHGTVVTYHGAIDATTGPGHRLRPALSTCRKALVLDLVGPWTRRHAGCATYSTE